MADILADYGQVELPLTVDQRELAVSSVVGALRGQIVEAFNRSGISQAELARRMNVSKAMVSRFLKSDGDLYASTAALFAFALDGEWKIMLRGNSTSDPLRRVNYVSEINSTVNFIVTNRNDTYKIDQENVVKPAVWA